MKNQLFVIILILTTIQSLLAQTESQQESANAYYQNQNPQKRYTNSWYWLFGTANSGAKNDKNQMVSWELEDGGWYAGLGKKDSYTGYGIQYQLKSDSYMFSNWKNTKPNGMTLSQSPNYSFMELIKMMLKMVLELQNGLITALLVLTIIKMLSNILVNIKMEFGVDLVSSTLETELINLEFLLIVY